MGGGGQASPVASDTAQGVGTGAAIGGPWGAAVGGAVGLVGGLMAGNKASGYEAQQEAALKADTLAREKYLSEQAAINGPIQQRMATEAASPTPLNFGANLGNINQQTQLAQQRLFGQMARMGMSNSGQEAAGVQGLEAGRVGQLSQAFNTGLNARTKLGMGLLQKYNPLENAKFGEGALGQQMKFGAGEQALYNGAMQQGLSAVGKGIAGVLAPNNPQTNPGQQITSSLTPDQSSAITNSNYMTGLNLNGNAQNANDIAAAQQMPGGLPGYMQPSTVQPGEPMAGMGLDLTQNGNESALEQLATPDAYSGMGFSTDTFSGFGGE